MGVAPMGFLQGGFFFKPAFPAQRHRACGGSGLLMSATGGAPASTHKGEDGLLPQTSDENPDEKAAEHQLEARSQQEAQEGPAR